MPASVSTPVTPPTPPDPSVPVITFPAIPVVNPPVTPAVPEKVYGNLEMDTIVIRKIGQNFQLDVINYYGIHKGNTVPFERKPDAPDGSHKLEYRITNLLGAETVAKYPSISAAAQAIFGGLLEAYTIDGIIPPPPQNP